MIAVNPNKHLKFRCAGNNMDWAVSLTVMFLLAHLSCTSLTVLFYHLYSNHFFFLPFVQFLQLFLQHVLWLLNMHYFLFFIHFIKWTFYTLLFFSIFPRLSTACLWPITLFLCCLHTFCSLFNDFLLLQLITQRVLPLPLFALQLVLIFCTYCCS